MRNENVNVLVLTTVNCFCVIITQDHSNSTPTYAAIFSTGRAHWTASHAV